MAITTPDGELIHVIARDWLKNFMASFAHSIKTQRSTSIRASAAMIDGLAAVTALAIIGRHGSQDEIIESTIKRLRENIDRDLIHLGTNVHSSQAPN